MADTAAGRSRSFPPVLRWVVLVLGVGFVVFAAAQVYFSFFHPYTLGATLEPATVVSKQEVQDAGATRRDNPGVHWEVDVQPAGGGQVHRVYVGIHQMYGKEVGDQVEIYQLDSGWQLRDYHSPWGLAGYLGLLVLGLLTFGWWVRDARRRRSRRSNPGRATEL